jgi:hypothetical protein
VRKLRRFLVLGPEERRLTIEALLLPTGISASFRLFGVPRTQAWIRGWAVSGKNLSAPVDRDSLITVARRAQGRAKRATGVLGPCLVRSLTLWAMLLRRGIETDLRIGFRKRNGKVEGHAWLEYHRQPINEAESEVSTYSIYDRPVRFDLWLRQKNGKPAL